MGKRTQAHLVRYFQLLECLKSRSRGWTAKQLSRQLEVSLSTIYRDFESLRETPLPLRRETVNGEKRYSLATLNAQQISVSPDVLTVLWLARQELSPLEGTKPIKALDALLQKIGASANLKSIALASENVRNDSENALQRIEEAIRKGRRLILNYQGAKDSAAQARVVEPVEIRTWRKAVYCTAWCLKSDGWRIFKLLRVLSAEVLAEKASAHPDFEPDEVFAHSMGIWSGEAIRAEIWIAQSRSRLVREYPLSTDQEIEQRDDGSIVVRATIAGPKEVLQWVQRWGRNAEVLSPAGLRQQIAEELFAAAAHYDDLRDSILKNEENNLSHKGENPVLDASSMNGSEHE